MEGNLMMKKPDLTKIRTFLLGSRTSYGLVFNVVLYLLLLAIGFVYLYPLLFMFVTSMKSPTDLLNPMVQWVPTGVYLGNYEKAFRVLDYPTTLVSSILVSVLPSLITAAVCSLVGYGLARYRFAGKTLVFALILATFIIPAQNTVIPQMLTYKDLGLLGNIFALLLPAMFGPVTSRTSPPVSSATVSLATNVPCGSVTSSTGWRPSRIRRTGSSTILGRQ